MKKTYLILLAASFAFACGEAPDKAAEEQTEQEMTEEQNMPADNEEMATAEDSTHFGKMIDEDGAVYIDEFTAMMDGKDSMEVKIRAIAQDVCQKKGCWMKVELADGETMRIKFKDYGFFVPKDISGKEVVFSGKAFVETTSVEDLKHYAEDGGATAEEIEAITEPETKISFLADGVMIKS